MTVYRAQIAFTADDALPRDACVITPHYTASDPTGLANALGTALKALPAVNNCSFTINMYDAESPPPNHPVATYVNAGITPTSSMPREVAVCLSYYATLNQPRLRGRVYLPAGIFGFTPSVRIGPGDVARALTFGPALFKGLPSGAQAVVWSRKIAAPATITNYWVDNEWDTVRSRGLVATTRSTGTVP